MRRRTLRGTCGSARGEATGAQRWGSEPCRVRVALFSSRIVGRCSCSAQRRGPVRSAVGGGSALFRLEGRDGAPGDLGPCRRRVCEPEPVPQVGDVGWRFRRRWRGALVDPCRDLCRTLWPHRLAAVLGHGGAHALGRLASRGAHRVQGHVAVEPVECGALRVVRSSGLRSHENADAPARPPVGQALTDHPCECGARTRGWCSGPCGERGLLPVPHDWHCPTPSNVAPHSWGCRVSAAPTACPLLLTVSVAHPPTGDRGGAPCRLCAVPTAQPRRRARAGRADFDQWRTL